MGKLDSSAEEHIVHLSFVFVLSRYVAHHLHDSHRINMEGWSAALDTVRKCRRLLLRSLALVARSGTLN